MEKSGKLYEAIQFYRRAMQLVPDIEFRLYDTSKTKSKEQQNMKEDLLYGKFYYVISCII